MKYLQYTMVFVICSGVILCSACSKEETAVVNMKNAIKLPIPAENPNSRVQGRTIKLGENKSDSFGPSFEFDKLH